MGTLGIANRPNGYDQEMIDFLKPFISTCATILSALKLENEHQKITRQLGEKEELYRTILRTSREGFCVCDKDGRLMDVNNGYCMMSGYERDELLGLHISDLEAKETDRDVAQHIQKIFSSGFDRFESVHFRKDGSRMDVLVSAQVVNADKGFFVSFISDITDRKKAKEALRKSEEFSNKLLASMKDGLSVLNKQGVHTRVNPALCAMTGLKEEEIIGTGLPHPYWPEEEYPRIEESFQKTMRGEFQDFEMVFKHKNGRRFPVIASPSYVTDDKGEVVGYFATVKDISDIKQAEQSATASMKEKEILLKELHHRVKNNMQVIISLMNLQSRKMDNEKLGQAFLESQSRIYAMAAVHEILYQTSNLVGIELKRYLSKLCQAAFKTYRTDLGYINLSMEIPLIEVRLEQAYPIGLVINELLSNAFKYAFPGGKQGKIDITGEKYSSDRVRLVVQDDGVGMPKGFDWRNTDSLGLQIVRTLVQDQLGGAIETDASKGTRFEISFPL